MKRKMQNFARILSNLFCSRFCINLIKGPPWYGISKLTRWSVSMACLIPLWTVLFNMESTLRNRCAPSVLFWLKRTPFSDAKAAAKKGLKNGPVGEGVSHDPGPVRVHPGRLPFPRQRQQRLQCVLRNQAKDWWARLGDVRNEMRMSFLFEKSSFMMPSCFVSLKSKGVWTLYLVKETLAGPCESSIYYAAEVSEIFYL